MHNTKNTVKSAFNAKKFMKKFCAESEEYTFCMQKYYNLSKIACPDFGVFHYLIESEDDYVDVFVRLKRRSSKSELAATLHLTAKDSDYKDIRDITRIVTELKKPDITVRFLADKLSVSKKLTSDSGFFTVADYCRAADEVLDLLTTVRDIIYNATQAVVMAPSVEEIQLQLSGVNLENSSDEASDCSEPDEQDDAEEDEETSEDCSVEEILSDIEKLTEPSPLPDFICDLFSHDDVSEHTPHQPTMWETILGNKSEALGQDTSAKRIMKYFKSKMSNN